MNVWSGVEAEIVREQLEQVFVGDLVKNILASSMQDAVHLYPSALDKVIIGIERRNADLIFVLSQDWYLTLQSGASTRFWTYTDDFDFSWRWKIQGQGNSLFIFDSKNIVKFHSVKHPNEVLKEVSSCDILDVDLGELIEKFKKVRTNLSKRASWHSLAFSLNDPLLLTGLNSLYISDALWKAKLLPERPFQSLSSQEIEVLCVALRFNTRNAKEVGGYGYGLDGFHGKAETIVYEKVECPSCKVILKQACVSLNSIWYCTNCQH